MGVPIFWNAEDHETNDRYPMPISESQTKIITRFSLENQLKSR